MTVYAHLTDSWPVCTTTLKMTQMPPTLTSILLMCCCTMSKFRSIRQTHPDPLCYIWLRITYATFVHFYPSITITFTLTFTIWSIKNVLMLNEVIVSVSLQLHLGTTGQLQIIFWTAGWSRLLRLLLCPPLQSDHVVCKCQELPGESPNYELHMHLKWLWYKTRLLSNFHILSHTVISTL